MPIQTDFNISPYYDDFDPEKDFYKILFRPGVAVQVRELNQLQTLLQKQVERFGDYVLERGTIVNGCAITYHSFVPYIKLKDTTPDGAAVDPVGYEGLFVKHEATGLIAEVIASATGYEAQDPDLATLYLEYKNEGTAGNLAAFSAANILKVYNKDERIYSVTVTAGSTGFSNNDSVVILSALELQNTTGGTTFSNTFAVGELVTQATTNAQGIVVSSNTTANTTAQVLSIKPVDAQLALGNTLSWSFSEGYEITGNTSATTANVVGFVGSDATGTLTTAAAGRVANIDIVTGGSLYYVVPQVAISTASANTSQIGAYSFTAKNYLANVTISSLSGSVGSAYGVTMDTGIIYQKGFFSRTEKQFKIVEKYSNTPHDVAVGFTTVESIVNSSADSTLLDNAAGYLNENAPGANRLKLTPVLTYKTKLAAEADEEFLPIIEFTEGKPYKTTDDPQLAGLGNEFARRTYDESGNYVLDPFLITTKDRFDFADTENSFSMVIDPGHAYINGNRVQTQRNYIEFLAKANTVTTVSNASIDVVYGNYIKINELGGVFDFDEGAQISLRDTAKNYLTVDPTATPAAGGAEIGKARMRSLVYDSGEPGTPNCVYRLYIFDIRMNAGRNFRDVKSVWYDSTYDGVADLVLELDPSSNANIAVVKQPEDNALLFGQEKIVALKSANSFSYTYRTCNTTLECNTSGIIVATAGAGEVWDYAGTLTSTEERDLIVIPRDTDITAAANLAGSAEVVASNSSIATVNGTSTTWLTDLAIGDYITLDDAANTAIARVTSIANNTSMSVVATNATSTILSPIAAGANVYITFPKNVPIPFVSRTGRTANVVGTALNIDIGETISATSNVSVIFNAKISNAAAVTKTVNRKAFVKIQANTHSATVNGPWCLGFSDVFRLRNVYAGATTSDTNITKHFFIDHNQNENYYDLALLKKLPHSNYTIGANDVLLVEFDLLTHSAEGLKALPSYNINDSIPLANLDAGGTEMNTLEIPECITSTDEYFDLRDTFDFRPRTANTVAIVTVAGSAPTNPALATESTRFVTGNKKFPVPEGDLFLNYQQYEPRTDSVVVRSDAEFDVLYDEVRMNIKPDEMVLYTITIPPYPSLPVHPNSDTETIMHTHCGPGFDGSHRIEFFTIDTEEVSEQPRGYTMKQIGQLERRIEALEYYSMLSETEDDVKNSVIPSSIDATLNRFKFGFFVDNYTTTNYTDLTNPEYNCSVYEYRLAPARTDLNIDLRLTNTNSDSVTGDVGHFPYEPYTLINQPVATDGPIQQANVVANTVAPVISYKTQYVFKKYYTSAYDRSPANSTATVYEDHDILLTGNTSANGQEIVIYFNVLGGKDRIEVLQSTTINGTYVEVANSESCNNATQAEINMINNMNFYDRFHFGSRNFSREDAGFGYNNFWIKNSGTLKFNYDISKGRYLRIREKKGSPMHYYVVAYPVDDPGTPSTTGNIVPAKKTQHRGSISVNHQHRHGRRYRRNGIHKTLFKSMPCQMNRSKAKRTNKCGIGHSGPALKHHMKAHKKKGGHDKQHNWNTSSLLGNQQVGPSSVNSKRRYSKSKTVSNWKKYKI
jgi:hypothetical protein